jgi:hypothetical protein
VRYLTSVVKKAKLAAPEPGGLRWLFQGSRMHRITPAYRPEFVEEDAISIQPCHNSFQLKSQM